MIIPFLKSAGLLRPAFTTSAVAAPNATLAAPRAQRTLVENAVELLVQDHLRQLPLDRLQRQLDNLRNMRNLQARGGGEGGSEGK